MMQAYKRQFCDIRSSQDYFFNKHVEYSMSIGKHDFTCGDPCEAVDNLRGRRLFPDQIIDITLT